MTSWVVFSDLDESLLDRDTYSFEAARPALEELRRREIPLVLCTSKTAAETLHVQKLLGNREPFIVEGGGGIYLPRGYFADPPAEAVERGDHLLIPLSAPREEILAGLGHLKELTANSIRGFDDMTDEEVARMTNLPLKLAVLARQREFDEPFMFVRREAEFSSRVLGLVYGRGLRVVRGGRFYHLHGNTDKGSAVKRVMALYRRKLDDVRSIAVGDSEMDFPMLREADIPIAVRRRDGLHDAVLEAGVRRLVKMDGVGPAGWNEGVLRALETT